MKRITTPLIIALFSCFLTSSATFSAESSDKKIVFGVASDKAIQTLVYKGASTSLKTTFNGIEQVPGFEGCKIEQYVMGAAGTFLVCNGKKFQLNASTFIGDCEYLGLHRSDGLGFNKKATWETWALAAKICKESAEKIKVFEKRKTNLFWAGEDIDPRF